MSHDIHETELVKTVEAELPPWREYIAIGLDEDDDTQYWYITNPEYTPEAAIQVAHNNLLGRPITIHHIPDPRKPQPVPKIVIDWEAVENERPVDDVDWMRAVERHARIEVTP